MSYAGLYDATDPNDTWERFRHEQREHGLGWRDEYRRGTEDEERP